MEKNKKGEFKIASH